MRRAIRIVAVASGGLAAAGCSSSLPSFDFGLSPSAAPASTIELRSEPPGAEAKTSVGPSCRTPCSLGVPTNSEFTVTFALDGFAPQTVAVTPRPPSLDPREGAAGLQFDPNPVYAELEPAPPSGKKKKTKSAKPAKSTPPPKQPGPS